jgi:hypothetical protein
MRLVDTIEEQAILESLLDNSKPSLPPSAQNSHWLIATPFRYTSPQESRFRRANNPGIWYGAEEIETAAAEIGYWRWRFFAESVGLRENSLHVELTFFQAIFKGVELDITQSPWIKLRSDWRDPNNYATCHALADAVRAQGLTGSLRIQGIRYESARLEHGVCMAVFDPHALSLITPEVLQTWTCKVTKDRVLLVHDGSRFQFDFGSRAA